MATFFAYHEVGSILARIALDRHNLLLVSASPTSYHSDMTSPLICIGTTSAIKLAACQHVVTQLLAQAPVIIGCPAESGVSDTPWNEETLIGAKNRAAHSRELEPDADIWIGLESGLVSRFGELFEEAWAVVLTKEAHYLGISSALPIPQFILREMSEHQEEHRHTMHRLRANPDGPKDTWGEYTGGLLQRTVSLQESLRNALIQVVAPEGAYYRRV